ncbi:MAG TPA: AAA family ATPase [Polyangiaceae bacterium]|nr:AAA family ATPase [Polyangiaceae bacterium]
MFTGVEIENFRGFGKLELTCLGRVNLIVGKNNTGKTSLLEAITLLADPATIRPLPGLFRANAGSVGEQFYRWLLKDGAGTSGTLLSAHSGGEETSRIVLTAAFGDDDEDFTVRWASEALRLLQSKSHKSVLRVHAVSVQHNKPDSMIDAFAEAVRAPVDERQMESLLASVDPRIKSVRLDAMQSKPFIVVDVGLTNRVPLSQAGQGLYRLVAIFSELLGNKPDLCFIDEIENGIHYTALPAVWKGIGEVAARLGVQVFATTHSRECLVAAHEAFAARDAYDLRVVQLYRLGDASSGRVLDRAHIEAAIAGDIEVR